MNTLSVLKLAKSEIEKLQGSELPFIKLTRPTSIDELSLLSTTISKLSPFVGNYIESYICSVLNNSGLFHNGKWQRQDPGFPDTVFINSVKPIPGIEIKAWLPFSTEITARFKDSQSLLLDDNTLVCQVAWIPSYITHGYPKVVSINFTSALDIAKSRDYHYFNPPSYLVIEPLDTSNRTANLQQSNTSGYRFQGNQEQFRIAQIHSMELELSKDTYSPTPEYQARIRELLSRHNYRLDTNFGKVDRIDNASIEAFKAETHNTVVLGKTIHSWKDLFSSNSNELASLLEL